MSIVVETLPKLDFTEALKDSPRFRQAILVHEQYFAKLDSKLTEVALSFHGYLVASNFKR
uniref:Bm12009 n=1 Tax=Brugia malayi TaxID=6279 RepID=A0A1I9GDX3_BRUMA|nr:Bm12009 [Brugia malayi]